MKVAVVDYGAGNIRSVAAALYRLGATVECTDDLKRIKSASRVIFPGVGHAAHAMAELRKRGLLNLCNEVSTPFLGICLGMQLLSSRSEEGETDGLGLIDGVVAKFPESVKVPHIGWTPVAEMRGVLFKDIPLKSYFYFLHSYCVPLVDYTVGTALYGSKFSAAIQREHFFGVQFHPEKSGKLGAKILENFLRCE